MQSVATRGQDARGVYLLFAGLGQSPAKLASLLHASTRVGKVSAGKCVSSSHRPARGSSPSERECQMSKPLIGLNADYRSATGERPAYSAIAARYYDCVAQAGGIPVIVPPLTEENDLGDVLDRLDGFVLTGGPDLDPRLDGFMLHPAVRPMDRRREKFDRMLAHQIVQRRLPVFGIGVGMQLLNNTLGGNLFLHLPEDMPGGLPHKDPQDPSHRHGLEVLPNSVMERVFGDGEIRVNSMHHMAIDELGEGLRVTARCPDGVIEAIESDRPDWFVMGTQFHPEASSASALDMRIFEEYIAGVTGVELALPLAA